MLEVLERVQSIYVPAFQSMLQDVEAGESLGQLCMVLIAVPCHSLGCQGAVPSLMGAQGAFVGGRC